MGEGGGTYYLPHRASLWIEWDDAENSFAPSAW